ncbi:MAG: DUF1579 family protein [Kouleothrix sp.]|nr:DUF1579 family protein [Kouleothrix sp.]
MSDQATIAWAPRRIAAGEEMTALRRFFMNCTWTGVVHANGMGAGSPAMDAIGRMACRDLMDGLWIACDCAQDQFVAGELLLTWQLQLIVGWDVLVREYRAVLVDSNGIVSILRGEMQGDTFTMTPLTAVQAAGEAATIRLVWDAADPQALRWLNEASINGGPWVLIEEYLVTPTT